MKKKKKLLAANSPLSDTDKACMESHLHIEPVEIVNCFIFHAYIYIVSYLLCDQKGQEKTSLTMSDWMAAAVQIS